MTDRDLIVSMSHQLAELVRNVGEVRQSNRRLETEVGKLRTDVDAMREEIATIHREIDGIHQEIDGIHGEIDGIRGDIDGIHREIGSIHQKISDMDKKFDQKIAFISGKIDHFIDVTAQETTMIRTRIEEERYASSAERRRNEERFEAIERRLTLLETARNN